MATKQKHKILTNAIKQDIPNLKPTGVSINKTPITLPKVQMVHNAIIILKNIFSLIVQFFLYTR